MAALKSEQQTQIEDFQHVSQLWRVLPGHQFLEAREEHLAGHRNAEKLVLKRFLRPFIARRILRIQDHFVQECDNREVGLNGVLFGVAPLDSLSVDLRQSLHHAAAETVRIGDLLASRLYSNDAGEKSLVQQRQVL